MKKNKQYFTYETDENKRYFNGIFGLRNENIKMRMTSKQIEEIKKCKKDPLYFMENYTKIISLDDGLIPFEAYDFQKELLNLFINENRVIARVGRQSGKCVDYNSWITIRLFKIFSLPIKIGFLYKIISFLDEKF